ncbi:MULTISPECIES: hypothetical protein [Sphingomonadaceae]|uniref:hypothetical protein n=1 Tax=Sphingomonadales TaxID=204457 RepID=UPI0007702642|nr:hypothetical protein [Sphingobium sp. TKS]AMK23248.1 hypothetical protein K426_11560 [Sphingobium sp. TKS]MCF8709076.1 hypothetical protein [Rhizorhapis sp. SPR117]
MKIELRRITYSDALSQETSAYTADVYIDGELAFHARNQGTGGADFFHQVGRWTEAEVNSWLEANRSPRVDDGFSYDHDLEIEVSDLLSRELEARRVKRLLRTNLVTIENGQIFQYPLRKRPIEIVVRAVRATNPAAIVVNDAGDDVLDEALAILLAPR